MNDFWSNIDGAPEHAFSGVFQPIPDETIATAEIVTFELMPETERFSPHYQIKWRIIDGEHKKRVLFHKIKAFDENKDKALRARNFLMLIYKLASVDIPDGVPGNDELMPFQGKILDIKVRHSVIEGKDINWVSEVYKTGTIDSALSRNANVNYNPVDDFPL